MEDCMANALAWSLRERGVRAIDALIILGSGMSGCYAPEECELLHDAGGSRVMGHTGKLVLLRTAGMNVLLRLGRSHLYEGHIPSGVTSIVEQAAHLRACWLIVTNAAGGLDPRFRTGDVMLIESCLGAMLGKVGGHLEGSRSIDAVVAPSRAFDVARERALESKAHPQMFATENYGAIEKRALARGLALRRGVYAGVLGPSYETRAEIRMLRRIGADAVGMSTVLEAAAARSLGMRTIGLSLITNVLSDTGSMSLDHADVVEQGRLGEARIRAALDATVEVVSAALM